jgi:FAD/FMN-containing dehydrogenase
VVPKIFQKFNSALKLLFFFFNQCNDPELFWAIRGGGGGTYATLTKFRVQLYPSVPIHTYTFIANFTDVGYYTNATKNDALREIMTVHAQNQLEWSAQLVTGNVEYFPEKLTVGLVLPYGDDGSKLKAATRSFAEFLSSRTDLSVSQNNYTSYPSYADYLSVTAARAQVTEPSEIFSLLATQLIPRTVFTADDTIYELVEGVLQAIATSRSLLNVTGSQIVSATPVTNLDKDQLSSAHPAWRSAIWHVILVGEWLEPLSKDNLQNTTEGFLDMLSL